MLELLLNVREAALQSFLLVLYVGEERESSYENVQTGIWATRTQEVASWDSVVDLLLVVRRVQRLQSLFIRLADLLELLNTITRVTQINLGDLERGTSKDTK